VVQQTLVFPLLILSGVLLPLENAPAWFNPLTYIVEAERALFAGNLSDPSVLNGMFAAGVVAALGLLMGVRGMKQAAD